MRTSIGDISRHAQSGKPFEMFFAVLPQPGNDKIGYILPRQLDLWPGIKVVLVKVEEIGCIADRDCEDGSSRVVELQRNSSVEGLMS